MFGFFQSELRKSRKCRAEFEDIRQRYLLKMNDFERSSFVSAIQMLNEELGDKSPFKVDDHTSLEKLGDLIRRQAQDTFRVFASNGTIGGEGGRAGCEGIALLSLLAHAKSLNTAEAIILVQDIENFCAKEGIN